MEKLNIFLRKSFEPVLFFFPCPSVSILHLALVLLPDEFRFISFLFFSSGHLPSPIHVSGRTGVWYILDGGRGGGSSNRATRNPLASSFFFFPAVVFLRSRLHDWKQSTTKCALTHSLLLWTFRSAFLLTVLFRLCSTFVSSADYSPESVRRWTPTGVSICFVLLVIASSISLEMPTHSSTAFIRLYEATAHYRSQPIRHNNWNDYVDDRLEKKKEEQRKQMDK